jgi:hypothetical protein
MFDQLKNGAIFNSVWSFGAVSSWLPWYMKKIGLTFLIHQLLQFRENLNLFSGREDFITVDKA